MKIPVMTSGGMAALLALTNIAPIEQQNNSSLMAQSSQFLPIANSAASLSDSSHKNQLENRANMAAFDSRVAARTVPSTNHCPRTGSCPAALKWVEGGTETFNEAFPPYQWIDFGEAYDWNRHNMKWSGNMSETDISQLKAALVKASEKTKLDPRWLLSIAMQESNGDIRVRSTIAPDGSSSAGPMQCNGSPSAADFVGRPVPQDLVDAMVLKGAEHFKRNLNDQGGNVYEAFRKYNSGSVNPRDLNYPFSATRDYVIKCANRLQGWRY